MDFYYLHFVCYASYIARSVMRKIVIRNTNETHYYILTLYLYTAQNVFPIRLRDLYFLYCGNNALIMGY